MDIRADMEALLRLQIAWGADEALAEEPLDRLQPRLRSVPATPVRRPPVPAASAPQPLPGTPAGTPAERAMALAAEANSLPDLRAALAGFDGCALRQTATNLVFADGDGSADLLVVGEPPGVDEDQTGKPFAGRDGDLLDAMLSSIGLHRSELLLTPLIPWRPPGGRPPSPGELAVCLPFLHRLVALAGVRRVLIVGDFAARTLLRAAGSRRPVRGRWLDCAIPGVSDPPEALCLPGLAALVKTPSLRRDAWAALRLLRRTLDDQQPRS